MSPKNFFFVSFKIKHWACLECNCSVTLGSHLKRKLKSRVRDVSQSRKKKKSNTIRLVIVTCLHQHKKLTTFQPN